VVSYQPALAPGQGDRLALVMVVLEMPLWYVLDVDWITLHTLTYLESQLLLLM
jgi:hypothetical protein